MPLLQRMYARYAYCSVRRLEQQTKASDFGEKVWRPARRACASPLLATFTLGATRREHCSLYFQQSMRLRISCFCVAILLTTVCLRRLRYLVMIWWPA